MTRMILILIATLIITGCGITPIPPQTALKPSQITSFNIVSYPQWREEYLQARSLYLEAERKQNSVLKGLKDNSMSLNDSLHLLEDAEKELTLVLDWYTYDKRVGFASQATEYNLVNGSVASANGFLGNIAYNRKSAFSQLKYEVKEGTVSPKTINNTEQMMQGQSVDFSTSYMNIADQEMNRIK